MIKKLMSLALVVVLTAALVGGFTMAWFTDSAGAGQATFAAGTVKIEAGSSSIMSQYFDPAEGVFVYGVMVNSGDLYEVDVENQIENMIFENPNTYNGFYPNALAFDNPKDRLYFAGNRTTLWYYDFSANALVNAGTFQHTGSMDVYAAAFGGGYYWYIPNGTNYLYKVAFGSDGKIASSSNVRMPAGNLSFGDVEIDYANGIIYGSTTSFYFTYDTSTGVFTNLGNAGGNLQLAWGHDGKLYGHRTNGFRWSEVNPATGQLTFLFNGQRAYNDLASGSKSYWNPGDCAWAKFNVQNIGTKKSYVRLSLSGYWTEYVNGEWVPWSPDPDEFPDCYQGDVVTLSLGAGMDASWEEKDGLYYYKHVLAPNNTAGLTIRVCLKGEETCNAYQGKRFVLTGTFDAIQTTHGASQELWNWTAPQ